MNYHRAMAHLHRAQQLLGFGVKDENERRMSGRSSGTQAGEDRISVELKRELGNIDATKLHRLLNNNTCRNLTLTSMQGSHPNQSVTISMHSNSRDQKALASMNSLLRTDKHTIIRTPGQLNACVLDAFLMCLQDECPDVLLIPSTFWVYFQKNPSNAARFFEKAKKRPDEFNKIIVPINRAGVHWKLGVIDVNTNEIRHYNAWPNTQSKSDTDTLAKMFDPLLKVRLKPRDQDNMQSYPQSTNGHDCGPMVCMYAYVESRYHGEYVVPTIQAERMQDFRKLMAYKILTYEHIEVIKRTCDKPKRLKKPHRRPSKKQRTYGTQDGTQDGTEENPIELE